MSVFYDIQEAKERIRKIIGNFESTIGIILGTGLSGLSDSIEEEFRIPYQNIPKFPIATVSSHDGALICGKLNGKRVFVLAGRLHYYEGYSLEQVSFPVRVLAALGITQLIVSNAAGGLNPEFHAGQITLVQDHINLMPSNPLRGVDDTRLGPRFPDLLDAYSLRLREIAHQAAKKYSYDLHESIYVCLQGPSLETPAEYRFLRLIGGDLVGMSTVPEVIVARQMQIEVLCFSVVTNVCMPTEILTKTTVEEVIAVANSAEKILTPIVASCVEKMA